MFRVALAVLILFSYVATASAQQWADSLFQVKTHDFGPVARAAKVEYRFPIVNPYDQEIHISSVRSSCGCTMPRVEEQTIPANGTGEIIAAFNTWAFTGQRGARVTVTLDRPQYAEVQLQVSGYIRTDVVLNPNLVNFGALSDGQTAEKTVKIEYAGRNDWQITGVKTNSPYLQAEIKETGRANGRVGYELLVKLLEGAPTGYLNEQLLLTTNDRRATQFPVQVEGRLEAELTVSPTPLVLGTLQPGQKLTKQIVVKGAAPFRILKVECAAEGFTFSATSQSDEAKAVHLLPIAFEAPEQIGKLAATIEIATDLNGGKSVKLPVAAQIGPPLANK